MDSLNLYTFPQIACREKPIAAAIMKGSPKAPDIHGTVEFYAVGDGTLVTAEIFGLPATSENFFAFHIHEGNSCTGDDTDPFKDTKGHFNPTNKEHSNHAGDMPALLSNQGYAYMSFYTARFRPEDVMHRTVVIHLNPDDFHTQPAGNAGTKIGCGMITPAGHPMRSH